MDTKDFDLIINEMEKNYHRMELLLGDLFNKLKQDPENEELRNIFMEIETISRGMLESEKGIIYTGCSDLAIKKSMLSCLDEKIKASKEARDNILARNK